MIINLESKKRGFTLIELMITVSILVILMSLAGYGAGFFKELKRSNELKKTVTRFKSSISLARSEAKSHNHVSYIQPIKKDSLGTESIEVGNDWSNGWFIFVDTNNNKSYNKNTELPILIEEILDKDYITITANGMAGGNEPYIGFSNSGYTYTKNGGTKNFTVCIKSEINTNKFKENRIKFSPTGSIRICDPAFDLSDCGDCSQNNNIADE